jgi:hypothetical protein
MVFDIMDKFLNKVQDERMRVLRIQKKEEGLEKAPT